MRTGLVLVGAVIAVLGGGLIVTLFFLSGGPTTTSQLSFENPSLEAHSVWPEVISRSTSTSASIGLSWSSSAPANVSLTPAGPCIDPLGVCAQGPAIFNWTLVTSGKSNQVTANASEYILEVGNPGNSSLRFTAIVSVSYHAGAPLPAWGWGLIAVGGITLLAIGGIAVFLGLFLPGGVYEQDERDFEGGPPPPDKPETGSEPPSG